MLKPTNDPHEVLEGDASLFGPGWREVVTFDDLTDEEEYTSDEEVRMSSHGSQRHGLSPLIRELHPKQREYRPRSWF